MNTDAFVLLLALLVAIGLDGWPPGGGWMPQRVCAPWTRWDWTRCVRRHGATQRLGVASGALVGVVQNATAEFFTGPS